MSVANRDGVLFCIAFAVSAVGWCGVPGFRVEVLSEAQIHASVEELLCQCGIPPESVNGPFLLRFQVFMDFQEQVESLYAVYGHGASGRFARFHHFRHHPLLQFQCAAP